MIGNKTEKNTIGNKTAYVHCFSVHVLMYVLLKEGLAVYKYHCTALTIDALENVYTVRSCTVL